MSKGSETEKETKQNRRWVVLVWVAAFAAAGLLLFFAVGLPYLKEKGEKESLQEETLSERDFEIGLSPGESGRDGKKESDAKAASKEDEEQKIRSGVPYVGLPESRIHDTSLGQATFIREYVSGSRKTVRIYKYYASGNSGKAIFTVYCSDGKVDIVLDNRSTSSGSSKPASGSEPS
ncbi:MAG: hypothetical protein IKY02_03805, partial [Lachnospiraceae bacterium]|nr:hypothetical protein [Lachnospiraceae bacterium]